MWVPSREIRHRAERLHRTDAGVVLAATLNKELNLCAAEPGKRQLAPMNQPGHLLLRGLF